MKAFWASKTLWINGLTLVGTGVGFFAGSLSSYPDLVCWLVLLQSAINLALRLLTKTGVSVTKTAEPAKG